MGPTANSRSRPSDGHSRHSQTGSKEVKEARQGGGSGWTEPPLEQAKPSYEDHGGMPYGVLEDMLPLGQAPSAKVKARVRTDPSGLKKIMGKNAGGLISDAHDTPEMTPVFDDDQAVAAAAAASLDPTAFTNQPLLIFDDDKDQDYMPRHPKKLAKPRLSRSSLARTAASSPAPTPTSSTSTPVPAPALSATTEHSRASAGETPVPVSAPKGVSVATATKRASKSEKHSQPITPQVNVPIANLDGIVAAAVKRSREVNNPSLGLAIREVHRQSLHDQHLMNLLLAILDTTATPEQNSEFRSHLSRAKRRIKSKEDAAKRVRKSPARHRNGVLSSSTSPRRSVAAPELVPRQSIEAPINQPKPKISIRISSQKKAAMVTQPTTTTNHVMPVPGRKQRAGTASSSSSLSSLTSHEDNVMDVDSADEAITTAQPLVQNPGLSAMGGNGLSAVGRLTLKRTSAEAEMDERDNAIAAKKQKYSEAVDRRDRSRPSHVRATPSRRQNNTAHNDAIIPPVRLIANGHLNQNMLSGEDTSADAASPLTEISSPASIRRGTPRAVDGPARTIKKKAKTKQS